MRDSDKIAIEEMAKIIGIPCYKRIEEYGDGSQECPSPLPCNECTAELLYNAGYRKQRTAEWVTTTETEDGLIVRYTHRCTDCNYFYKTVCPRGDDYCHKCGAKMKGV